MTRYGAELFVEIVTRPRFLRVCVWGGGDHVENPTQDKGNAFIFQKYVSGESVDKNVVIYNGVSQGVKKIHLRNVNRVIICHFNVNRFAVKIDAIKTIIPGNVDIMIFGETQLNLIAHIVMFLHIFGLKATVFHCIITKYLYNASFSLSEALYIYIIYIYIYIYYAFLSRDDNNPRRVN